jgi:hypothetical protein
MIAVRIGHVVQQVSRCALCKSTSTLAAVFASAFFTADLAQIKRAD